MSTNDQYRKHDIPATWIWARLGEICKVTDRDHRTPAYVKHGVPLISPRNFTGDGIDFSDLKNVEVAELTAFVRKCKPAQGDVLYSRIGTIGEARKLDFDFDFVALHSLALLKPNRYVVHPDWLFYLMKSPDVKGQAIENIKSVGTPDLGLKRIERFDVPVAPEAEQVRIVSKIDELFSRVDEGERTLKRVQKLVEYYRQSVLKAAVTGELTREWREQRKGKLESGEALLQRILKARRDAWEKAELKKMKVKGIKPASDKWKEKYQEPLQPSAVELSELPEGWVWASLTQLAAPERNAISDGPFGSNLKTEHYTDSGPRVVRLQNIKDGYFVDERAHISQERFESLQKHQVFAGDLVLAALGENLPRACVVPHDLGPAIVKADCIRFKPHESLAPDFLCASLNSPTSRTRTKSIIHGVGRPRLNLDEIRAIPIALPSAAEQQVIADTISRLSASLEHLRSETEQRLIASQSLRQAVLRAAFSGALVSQDGNDEPASVLLERIAAECSQTSTLEHSRPARRAKS